jgi:hypothetical protein
MTSPYPPRAVQDCSNCFYNEELFGLDNNKQVQRKFECRRHAPKATAAPVDPLCRAYWPEVTEQNWCGEWAPQEASE